MMGIRKKISLGFLCLGLMLAFSGMISLFELNRMSKTTRDVLESSSYNMELSKKMLDAIQDQNTALLQMIVRQSVTYDSAFIAAHNEFENTLAKATSTIKDRHELDSIYLSRANYNKLVGQYLDGTKETYFEWFLEVYKTGYLRLTSSIKDYMMSSQHKLLSKTSQLGNNAYRAITPGIITLCVSILMVIIFAFLIDLYYTRPIFGITKGLRNYINSKAPFNVKMEGRDEIFNLKEYIDTLINMYRNKKTE